MGPSHDAWTLADDWDSAFLVVHEQLQSLSQATPQHPLVFAQASANAIANDGVCECFSPLITPTNCPLSSYFSGMTIGSTSATCAAISSTVTRTPFFDEITRNQPMSNLTLGLNGGTREVLR